MESVKKSSPSEAEFPCLMIHRGTGTVFLMKSINTGFNVHTPNKSFYELGDRLKSIDVLDVIPFHGIIELSS